MSVITRTAAIAALLLASACSGQPEVLEPDPTAPASSTPSATPPPLPNQATESSDEGAASFAAYWIDLFNFASRTGDTSQLRKVSVGCKPCLEFASSAADLDAADRPSGDVWRIKATVVSRDEIASDVKFEIALLGGETSTVAFELSPSAPFAVTDLYRVSK